MVEQIEIERDYKAALSAQPTEKGCRSLFADYCQRKRIEPDSGVYRALGFHTSARIATIREAQIHSGRERLDELLKKATG